MDNETQYTQMAEASAVGAMCIDAKQILVVSQIVRPDDYLDARNGTLHKTLTDLRAVGMPVDMMTLYSALVDGGKIEQAGGVQYVAQMMDAVPYAGNARHYASIVRKLANNRRIRRLALQAKVDANETPEQARERIERALTDAVRSEPAPTMTLADIVRLGLSDSSELYQLHVPVLDELIQGVEAGSQIVIGGVPGTGKTALALQIAWSMAEHGIPVSFLSCEMGQGAIGRRAVAQIGLIDSVAIRRKEYTPEIARRIQDASDRLATWDLWVPRIEHADPEGILRQARSEFGRSRVVVLDYIQLIKGSGERRDEIDSMSRGFKLAAQAAGGLSIILSQLRRRSDEHVNRPPTMHDLKESGAIEADADLVLLLHCAMKDGQYQSGRVKQIQILLPKNRNGRAGIDTTAAFHSEYTRFDRLGQEHEQGE